MTLDERLLQTARDGGVRLAVIEREIGLARADDHYAVRDLHVVGGSLGDIAIALNLSHQRVRQIVDRAIDGWRRWWRRSAQMDMMCSFCGRPPNEVTSLIAGPKVFICDRCTALAGEVLGGMTAMVDPRIRLELIDPTSKLRCSFCGRGATNARRLVAGPGAHVCGECLNLCSKILAERAT